jgi:hypothetical protein
LQACSEIFIKPKDVFTALKTANNWAWVPFFLVVIFAVLPSYLYFSSVDQVYYENLLRNSADFQDLSPAEIDASLSFVKVEQLAWAMPIGTIIGILIVNAIMAIYYKLVTQSDEENLAGFTDWYGAMWWIGMPTIIGSLISILMILISNDGSGQIDIGVLNTTSIGYIFGVGMDSAWFNLANSARIESLLSFYIGAVAIGTWTRFSFNKCLLLAGIPYLVIYGVWIVTLIL